jgi:hypothetical protein
LIFIFITSKVVDTFDKDLCSANIKDYIAISGGKIKDTGGNPHDLIQNLHRHPLLPPRSGTEGAETLADIIQTGNTPLTIGVFGTWGSGKTSFLTRQRTGTKCPLLLEEGQIV